MFQLNVPMPPKMPWPPNCSCHTPIARPSCSSIAVPASATIIVWSQSPIPVIRSGTLRPAPGNGVV